MALKTKVIVTEITNLSDARYCAGMGVDCIGFCIDQSHEKYVDPVNYQDIIGWVAGVDIICETSSINEHSKSYKANTYLLDNIDALSSYSGDPVLWRIPINQLSQLDSLLNENKPQVSGIILDGLVDDEVMSFADIIKNILGKFEVYLDFNISTENVQELIEQLPTIGLALKGGEEIRPGFKDYDLADILELIEDDD